MQHLYVWAHNMNKIAPHSCIQAREYKWHIPLSQITCIHSLSGDIITNLLAGWDETYQYCIIFLSTTICCINKTLLCVTYWTHERQYSPQYEWQLATIQPHRNWWCKKPNSAMRFCIQDNLTVTLATDQCSNLALNLETMLNISLRIWKFLPTSKQYPMLDRCSTDDLAQYALETLLCDCDPNPKHVPCIEEC